MGGNPSQTKDLKSHINLTNDQVTHTKLEDIIYILNHGYANKVLLLSHGILFQNIAVVIVDVETQSYNIFNTPTFRTSSAITNALVSLAQTSLHVQLPSIFPPYTLLFSLPSCFFWFI